MVTDIEAMLAKERVARMFAELLDELVPAQYPAEMTYSDLLDRAMALRTAVYHAFLREYCSANVRHFGHDEEGIAHHCAD